jgi:hypothetical protein
LTLACLAAATGCATSPDAIPAAVVSPQNYAALDCQQLAAQHARVNATLRDATEVHAQQFQGDSAAMAGVIFPPAILAIRGNRFMAEEVSRLKGEQIAIRTAARERSCNIEE